MTETSRRPAPRPRPAVVTEPAPVEEPAGEAADRPSRAERRQAERYAGRRLVLRRSLQLAMVVTALVAVISIALVLASGGEKQAHSPSAGATTSVAGANMADPNAALAFLGSAASDVAAVTTYDYRNLDDALNAGLAVTTGRYRAAYRAALTGDLARTATAEHVTHTFEVLDIGIGAMRPDGTQAKVLVFGRERITDDSTGDKTLVSPITLCATIRHVGNRYLISDLVEGADPGLPPGGPDLRVAADAARAEVVNLQSYRRQTFAADLQRAIDGATSPLREQIRRSGPATERAMTKGRYDTSGAVTATAVVRADADTVTLMVAAEERRLVDGAQDPTVIQQRYEVTVTRTVDGWAVSRVSSVDDAG